MMKLMNPEISVFIIVFVINFDCNFVSSNRDGDRSRRPSRSLSAEVINATTITLKWPKGSSAAETPSCPVRRYLIRLKNQGTKRVRSWEVDAGKQSVSLHGLLPDTAYGVRLMVVNCEGRSKPSRWINVRTSGQTSSFRISASGSAGHESETNTPGQPRKVTSKAFSDYVIVSWEPPADDVEVRGYVIGYGEGVPDVNWQYLEGHRRNVTVKNLKKSTQYVISVRAFNNIGKGPVVYDLVFTRDNPSQASVSLAAPTNLRSKVLSHTTVWLQWTDPSLGRQQQQSASDNRYYSVHYQPLTGSGNDRSVVVKELHVVLYNLHPATAYEFKVVLVKDGLTSAFSNVVINRTLETTPFSPPRSVTVNRLRNDPLTVIVSWRPPKQPNGNITEYTVFYTPNVELPYEKWLTATARQRTDLALQGLNDSVTYYFRVHARNSVGPGPKSDIVKFDSQTTPVVAQGAATRGPASTGADASIPLVIALNETGEEDYDYTDGDKEEDRADGIQSASLVHERNAGDAVAKMKREPNLGSILPGVSVTSDPDGGVTQRQPFVRFHSVLSYKISAYITWPETECSVGGKVAGYRLRYRRSSEAGEYVARSLSENVALIEGLAPNTKYRYQVQYLMEDGTERQWSQEQELDTGAEITD